MTRGGFSGLPPPLISTRFPLYPSQESTNKHDSHFFKCSCPVNSPSRKVPEPAPKPFLHTNSRDGSKVPSDPTVLGLDATEPSHRCSRIYDLPRSMQPWAAVDGKVVKIKCIHVPDQLFSTVGIYQCLETFWGHHNGGGVLLESKCQQC